MIKSTKNFKIKNERLHFIIAFLIQIALLYICRAMHTASIGVGSNVQESIILGEQTTKPTLGRLVFMSVVFVLFIVFTIYAGRLAKKNQIYLPFIFGTLAGTFLWQAIGEDAWHFSIDGINMVRLESIEVLPLAILFVFLFFYIRIKHNVNWGIWCMSLSFGTNWMGHYVLEGISVFFKSIVEPDTFMLYIGCILGGILFILGAILGLQKQKTIKQRFELSVLCYFAMALIAFGIMGG